MSCTILTFKSHCLVINQRIAFPPFRRTDKKIYLCKTNPMLTSVYTPLLILLLLIFSVAPITAQQLPLQVLSPAGQSAQQGSYDYAWTFGEPLTLSYNQPATLLTQGFHQPELKVVFTGEEVLPALRVYPNPTQQLLFIEQADGGAFSLFSLNGQLLHSGSLSLKTSLDMQALAAAPYLLRIQLKGKDYNYSIIKTN